MGEPSDPLQAKLEANTDVMATIEHARQHPEERVPRRERQAKLAARPDILAAMTQLDALPAAPSERGRPGRQD